MQSIHQLGNFCENISYNHCTTQTKVIIAVSLILSLFLIGVGYDGYQLNAALWRNYAFMALGAAGVIATCIGGIWKISRPRARGAPIETPLEARMDYNTAPTEISASTKRPITLFLQAPEQKFIILKEILSHIFSYLGGGLGDLSSASLVCKEWYLVINNESSLTNRILNEAYGHGFPLHRQMDEQISKVFPSNKLWMIPTISKVLEEKRNFDVGYSSDYLIELLPCFIEKKASILKGQDTRGRWFFIVRCQWKLGVAARLSRPSSDPREGDAVIVIFQDRPETKMWLVGSASPGSRPSITPKQELSLGKRLAYKEFKMTVLDWITKLINDNSCGVLHRDGGNHLFEMVDEITSVTLWRP